jgi:hypothetical protein
MGACDPLHSSSCPAAAAHRLVAQQLAGLHPQPRRELVLRRPPQTADRHRHRSGAPSGVPRREAAAQLGGGRAVDLLQLDLQLRRRPLGARHAAGLDRRPREHEPGLRVHLRVPCRPCQHPESGRGGR